jgi:serine/threonine protein kinase
MKFKTGEATILGMERTLKIISQLGEALAHAHERGVLHLDLKPQNVIVLDYDEVVLVDWGAARLFAPERYLEKLSSNPEFAHFAVFPDEDDSLMMGTPRYMSPEQTDQARSVLGPASDIFSLGIIFYQMVTGRLPFGGESLEELLFHIRETVPPKPRKVEPTVHRRISSIIMRMLAKAPGDRYGSFEEVLGDLEEFRSTAGEFPTRDFAAGEQIFREGDDAEHAYMVVDGEIEIWIGEPEARHVIAKTVGGQVFGELGLFREGPRSASATASKDTQVRVIGQASLMNELEKLSPWVMAILSSLVEQYVNRSQRLVEMLRSEDDD